MRKRVSRSRSVATMDSLEGRRLFAASVPLTPALPADLNGDGTVNSADFGVMAAHWGKAGDVTVGDLNGDGIIDSKDFNALTSEFGKSTPVSQPPDGGTGSPPLSGNWNLAFNDEFESPVNPLDRGYVLKMWNKTGIGAEIDDANNVSVDNGVLSLTATRESDGTIHSGQIQSGGNLALGGKTPPLFGFQYGYIEARVDLPDGKGLWPAFWMMPVPDPSFHDGDGEIDIFDNGAGNPNEATGAVGLHGHWGHDNYANLSGGWHTVGIDWQPDHIDWYVDGKQIASMHDTALVPQTKSYFILGLQINDGQWGAAPDANTPFPESMNVDYVRVWQKA